MCIHCASISISAELWCVCVSFSPNKNVSFGGLGSRDFGLLCLVYSFVYLELNVLILSVKMKPIQCA